MAISFEQYYATTFEKWVDFLATRINDRDEAEDRVQDIFTSLVARKGFSKSLITRGEMDKYIQSAISRQRAQIYREQSGRVPTVSIDSDNIDFLSSIRGNQRDEVGEIESNDFYEAAVKLLEDSRKPVSDCGFETTGELRQYIFIQYCRNGRTFKEIGKLVRLSHQDISLHYGRIVTIVTPAIVEFIGAGLDNPEKDRNDLNISEN